MENSIYRVLLSGVYVRVKDGGRSGTRLVSAVAGGMRGSGHLSLFVSVYGKVGFVPWSCRGRAFA